MFVCHHFLRFYLLGLPTPIQFQIWSNLSRSLVNSYNNNNNNRWLPKWLETSRKRKANSSRFFCSVFLHQSIFSVWSEHRRGLACSRLDWGDVVNASDNSLPQPRAVSLATPWCLTLTAWIGTKQLHRAQSTKVYHYIWTTSFGQISMEMTTTYMYEVKLTVDDGIERVTCE